MKALPLQVKDRRIDQGRQLCLEHTCTLCGHKWTSMTVVEYKHVITAAKVNASGPYCSLCLHLTMAERYAEARGLKLGITNDPRHKA
jgi:hypothetical protein